MSVQRDKLPDGPRLEMRGEHAVILWGEGVRPASTVESLFAAERDRYREALEEVRDLDNGTEGLMATMAAMRRVIRRALDGEG